jgi:hypothetical protein
MEWMMALKVSHSLPAVVYLSSPAPCILWQSAKVHVTTTNYHMIISTNGLKLIEMHPLLVYADANLLGDSIDTVKKNAYTFN